MNRQKAKKIPKSILTVVGCYLIVCEFIEDQANDEAGRQLFEGGVYDDAMKQFNTTQSESQVSSIEYRVSSAEYQDFDDCQQESRQRELKVRSSNRTTEHAAQASPSVRPYIRL